MNGGVDARLPREAVLYSVEILRHSIQALGKISDVDQAVLAIHVERRFLPFLKALSHDVTRVGDDYPHGLLDQEVLAIANQEGRIVETSPRPT